MIAYPPKDARLIHVEASLDAHPWARRLARYEKKFTLGEKYILKEVFNWLPPTTVIERIAIFPSVPTHRQMFAGATLCSVGEFVKEVRNKVLGGKPIAERAIPEQYPFLRTMQLTLLGYRRYID